MEKMETRKALISVWDKTGILELAKGLAAHGYEIVSSSGTAKHLEEGGVKVTEVVDLTGLPAILGGRVKTLHPTIMGGILARRGLAQDNEDREKFNIRSSTSSSARYIHLRRRRRAARSSPATEDRHRRSLAHSRRRENYYHVAVVTEIGDYARHRRAKSRIYSRI
ncbi:MAG: hypothetical protein ACLUEQ_01400 [Cloacibacillus evryensis]